MTSVLEKLKALDAQRAQLLDDAKKEALDNAEKAVAELNELGFHYTLTEGAARHHPQERRAKPPPKLKLQSAKPETCPALSAISKRARITMGDCTGHKRPKSHSQSRNLWRRHLAKVELVQDELDTTYLIKKPRLKRLLL